MNNADVENAIKAILMLRSEMAQREARMSASFSQQMQSLQEQVGQFRQEVTGIVRGASAQIATEAKDAVSPVAREYDRAVSATSAHLQGASRTVCMWFAAAAAILLLVLLVGWVVLGYYRRELSTVKEELHRYENAIPVLEAYYASDAVICGDRVCANIDPNGQRTGDKRQYLQAKSRSRQ
jgi:hypothetical protein